MAQKVNIMIDQGTTFVTAFTIKDDTGALINLSSHTGYSQMRKHYTSANSYSFDVATDANGNITLSMNASVTNSITAGRYVYDVEVVDTSNNVSRVVEGVVTVTPTVTKNN